VAAPDDGRFTQTTNVSSIRSPRPAGRVGPLVGWAFRVIYLFLYFALRPEFYPTQPVSEPLLPESGALPGRAGEGQLLAGGLGLGEQACGAGLPEEAAEGRGLFPDAVRTALFQVGRWWRWWRRP